jgi:hypothetical protein
MAGGNIRKVSAESMVRRLGHTTMGKRNRYRDHVDPEYQRWGRRYPRFPGVAECASLIRAGKACGAWADIIACELAENAGTCLAELIAAFRNDPGGDVRLYVMMALDIARVPACVPFLAEVLREADPRYVPYAEQALRGINTPEARTALWNVARPEAATLEKHRGG